MPPPASMRPPAKVLLSLIIVSAAGLYLLGNGRVSLWDRDEPRYAQCSRQMLRGLPGPGGHGPDLIVPRYLTELRTEKPPLIYWCQGAAMKVFGENAFAARFPSAVAMTLVLILLAVVLYRAVGPRRATWAVFIMASSALTIMSAKMCLTDAMLLLWIAIAQLCMFAVYRGSRSWKVTLLLWFAVGMAGLTKGPIVLAVLGMTMVALGILDYISERRWAIGWWLALRPWIGIVIIAAVVGPWLWLVHHREPDFLPRLFGAAKRHLSTANEKHTAPPGYYLAMIWGLFFPWCLLLPTTLVIAWRNRRLPIIRYCLATAIGVWVFQEIMTTKLPFYLLPTFPALALLTADALVRCLRREYDDLLRPSFMVAVVMFAIAVLAMGGMPWLLTRSSLELGSLVPKGATAMLTAAAIVYAAVVFWLFKSRRIAFGAIAMGIGIMLIFALLFVQYLPSAQYLNTSSRVAAILRRQDIAPGDAVMIQYKEPSLAFYQGGSIREGNVEHLLDLPPDKWPTWIVLPRSLWERTRPERQAMLDVIEGPIRGIDYAGKIDGRRVVEVVVVRKKRTIDGRNE